MYHGRRHRIAGVPICDRLFGDTQDLTVTEELASIAEGPPLEDGTCLVRQEGEPFIFLLTRAPDGIRLHHVASYESFVDFRFDEARVMDVPRLLLGQVEHGRKLSSAADRAARGGWTGPTPAALQALGDILSPLVPQPLHLAPGDPVVVCTHGLPPGGAERQWVYLARGLAHLGLDVTFVVYDMMNGDNAHYLPLLRRSPVRLIDRSTPMTTSVTAALSPKARDYLQSSVAPEKDKLAWLTTTFARVRPKVVFAQLDLTNLLCGIASNLAGVPRTVFSFRNVNPTHFSYMDSDWFLPFYQELCASPRVVLSGNSREGNRDYAEWLDVPLDHVTFVPNALAPDLFAAADREAVDRTMAELDIRPDHRVILGVFRLSAEKDPLTFLDVCSRVISARPDVHVLIAGIGPLQAQMQARIEQLGLGDRVRLLGRRTDVNVLMALASILLLTSVREGMPNVLLEAQLSGVPIVATDVGGVRDAVVEDSTALLHRPGDAEGLARSCLAILNGGERAAAMAEAGRRHAQGFSCVALAKQHIALVSQASPTGGAIPSANWAEDISVP